MIFCTINTTIKKAGSKEKNLESRISAAVAAFALKMT
jgi:hypothetical protein